MATKDPSTTEFTWESSKPMPTKRVFATALQVMDQLFVVGGCDAKGVPVDNLENCKDPGKKKWSIQRNMPTPRAGVCAVAVEEKLMTFGGVNVNQEPTDVVEIYDTSTTSRTKHTWMTGIETMKERLLGTSAVVRNGKPIVIGGMGYDTNPKDYIMQYDLDENRWSSLPPLNTPRYATFSFLIDDILYVLGGRQGKTPVTALERLDFRVSKTETLPNIPTKRVFANYCHDSKQIFSLGGLNENPKDGFSSVTEIFDIAAGKWRNGQEMINKRGDFAAAVINNKVVVAGGLTNDGCPLSKSEVYDAANDTWSALSEMPSAHCSCAYTVFNDNFYVIGGLTKGGPSKAVECCSPL